MDSMQPATKKSKKSHLYNEEYSNRWSCFVRGVNPTSARCSICCYDVEIGEGGMDDCQAHVLSHKHKKHLKAEADLKSDCIIMKDHLDNREKALRSSKVYPLDTDIILTALAPRPKSATELDTMSNIVPALCKPAPGFKGTAVVDGQFKEICLNDYKGKYLILFFYPLDFTFVCPTEIIAFSERVNEFKKINCEIVACSTDSHFSHLAWINMPRKEGGLGNMDIPMLADKNMNISKSYGVLKEDDGIAFRGLFIIDAKQTLRQVTINDLPVGRDVDEALRLVQAFQFVDENGEVCPAGWRPGAKTMKADPIGSKDYFKSQN